MFFLQVLQSDGGLLSACINASTLALIHAGVELVDYVCSCTTSIYKDTPMLDVTQLESQSGSEVTVGMLPNKETTVSLHISNAVHKNQFQEVLELAVVGCQQVYQAMHAKVEEYLRNQNAIQVLRNSSLY